MNKTFRPFLVPFLFLVVSGIALGFVLETKENLVSGGYAECISSGYTKSFCLQTPSSAIGPAGCACPNGSIGTIRPGFRGVCICKDSYMNSQ